MKKALALFLLASVSSLHAQKAKTMSVPVPLKQYPELVPSKSYVTYSAEFSGKEGSVLPFNSKELKEALQMQSFSPLMDDNAEPDLFFVVDGVQPEDLNLDITRNKSEGKYYIDVYPKDGTKIPTILLANGENTHYFAFKVTPDLDSEKKAIPVKFEFSLDDSSKYLVFDGDSSAMATPYLVREYLVKLLGEDWLTKVYVPYLYRIYDYRVNRYDVMFSYFKDKDNPALEEETKGNLEQLEETLKSIATIEDLETNEEALNPFIQFWESKQGTIDMSSKKTTKMAWGIYANLANLYRIKGEYAKSVEYMEKAEQLKVNKWVTSSARKRIDNDLKQYQANFNTDGSRIYSDGYTVDPVLAAIAEKEELKSNNIVKEVGYIITKDGEKVEGKISLTFSTGVSGSQGNIVSLDGDAPAKKAVLLYKNEKGKFRQKPYKCKEVKEIVIGDKIFEPVNPKRSLADYDAVSLGMLNNTIFMQKLYSSDKIVAYKDLTNSKDYYFYKPGNKKAERASDEFFSACPDLLSKLHGGDFSKTDEDTIKIAEYYTDSCN